MFDYGDIINSLEEIVDFIENDELTLAEVGKKLQYLITEIEDNWDNSNDELGDFDFDDLA